MSIITYLRPARPEDCENIYNAHRYAVQYVHPFVHNQGLGTALLQRAEYLANKASLGLLKLYASLNSIKFYEINGYDSLGECELPLNSEVTVNCLLMRKYLID